MHRAEDEFVRQGRAGLRRHPRNIRTGKDQIAQYALRGRDVKPDAIVSLACVPETQDVGGSVNAPESPIQLPHFPIVGHPDRHFPTARLFRGYGTRFLPNPIQRSLQLRLGHRCGSGFL